MHFSQILLVHLSIGEAYIVDLRKEHRGRFELVEPQDEEDEELSRQQCVYSAYTMIHSSKRSCSLGQRSQSLDLILQADTHS